MASTETVLKIAFAPDRRNALTLAGIVIVFAISHVLAPMWESTLGSDLVAMVRYGAYLVLFCIWMVWFVETGVAIAQQSER